MMDRIKMQLNGTSMYHGNVPQIPGARESRLAVIPSGTCLVRADAPLGLTLHYKPDLTRFAFSL